MSISSTSTSSFVFENKQGGTFAQRAVFVTCMKSGTDAKQTAQVYKSIPKVADNINTFVASISDTGVVSGENADWINGNCTATGTNNATFTCTLQSLGISNTPVCNVALASTSVSSNVVRELTFSTSQIVYKTATTGGTYDAEAVNISCTKASTDFKMPVVQPIFSPASIVGAVVGSAYTQTGAYTSGSTTTPSDDTPPLNTEGVEFLTVNYTPKSASNLLKITVDALVTCQTGTAVLTTALFQDSIANALAAKAGYCAAAANNGPATLVHHMIAGTTSTIAFKARMGANTGNVYLNGGTASRLYGGVAASSIRVEEIQQ
jgi:hypothetical protein